MELKRRSSQVRNIQCEHCGEYYSYTYKICPFCGGGNRHAARRVEKADHTDQIPYSEPIDPMDSMDQTERFDPVEWDEQSEWSEPDEPMEQPRHTQRVPKAERAEPAPRAERAERVVAPRESTSRGGGKRLAPSGRHSRSSNHTSSHAGGHTRSRSPSHAPSKSSIFRKVMLVLSLVIIVAAIYIVIKEVVPLVQVRLGLGNGDPGQSQGLPGGTDPNGTQNTGAEPAVGIAITETEITLSQAGETHTLYVQFTPENAADTVTWVSSDQAVATVSDTGLVTAVRPGEATITASVGDKTIRAESKVICNWQDATANVDFSLNKTDFTMQKKGEVVKMKVAGTDQTPTWSVEDPSVVTIDQEGNVTAVGRGSTKILATIGNTTKECIVRCAF